MHVNLYLMASKVHTPLPPLAAHNIMFLVTADASTLQLQLRMKLETIVLALIAQRLIRSHSQAKYVLSACLAFNR